MQFLKFNLQMSRNMERQHRKGQLGSGTQMMRPFVWEKENFFKHSSIDTYSTVIESKKSVQNGV